MFQENSPDLQVIRDPYKLIPVHKLSNACDYCKVIIGFKAFTAYKDIDRQIALLNLHMDRLKDHRNTIVIVIGVGKPEKTMPCLLFSGH
jgi:hypothetical protein